METTSLSENENEELEHNLSTAELQNAIKVFHNNKTPGEHGFTKEFYDTVFDLLGNSLLDSFNAAFHHGKLSVTQKRGIISLIPKDESNLTVSSIGDGVTGAFSKLRSIWINHLHYFFPKMRKLK